MQSKVCRPFKAINVAVSIIFLIYIHSAFCWQAAPVENNNETILKEALSRLAKSADIHESFQYKIQCNEELQRMVHRRRDSGASFGFLPNETIVMRHGILITRDKSGVPQETRVKLDDNGNVVLNRKGIPKEISLPPEFKPISNAYPFSQIAWFTSKNQQYLNFRILSDKDKADPKFLIQCANPGEIAIEFLDKNQPILKGKLPDGQCTARASGQICLDPESGEVSLMNFYPLHPADEDCVWDFSHPFAIIEQNVIEKSTGARFPSRVETMVFLSWRDTAVFTQKFEECVFSDVSVIETLYEVKCNK